ncbi:MAG: hypothetical protein HXY40_08050 [Chloroflexi bacterium]|nr:hypothetical protein [Chloroflexota bacterium]
MPRLSRYFIKAGLLYFVLAAMLGTLILGRSALRLPPEIYAFTPVYYHLLMVGWVTQLIMGVAYWMFPKHSKEMPRGSEKLAWAVFIALNAGLLLRLVVEPLLMTLPALNLGGLLLLSALLQWLAGMGFIINTWTRVKER